MVGVQGPQWEIDQLGGPQWETPDAARRAATPVGTEWETPEAALWAAAPAGTVGKAGQSWKSSRYEQIHQTFFARGADFEDCN